MSEEDIELATDRTNGKHSPGSVPLSPAQLIDHVGGEESLSSARSTLQRWVILKSFRIVYINILQLYILSRYLKITVLVTRRSSFTCITILLSFQTAEYYPHHCGYVYKHYCSSFSYFFFFKCAFFSFSVISGVGELDLDNEPKKKSKPAPSPSSGPLDKPYPDCPFLLLDVRDRDCYDQCHVIGGKYMSISGTAVTVFYVLCNLFIILFIAFTK